MALRRRVILLGAVVPVLVVASAIAIVATSRPKASPAPLDWARAVARCDSLSDAALVREIARARRELSRRQPKGLYVVIDTHANQLFLRTEDSVVFRATCSTGAGHELVDTLTNRRWVFQTPKGVFTINSKLSDPWWRKPDWAFIEENQPLPLSEADRYDEEMLGDFAMGFGGGYFIHGTLYERLLGVSVTHGCVRLGSGDLKHVYDRVKVGTPVYIF